MKVYVSNQVSLNNDNYINISMIPIAFAIQETIFLKTVGRVDPPVRVIMLITTLVCPAHLFLFCLLYKFYEIK